jgi:predicted Zn-dependent protease
MHASRWIVVIVAIVTVAWFTLGARQAHDVGHATAIVQSSPLTPAAAARAAALLRSAGTLNPDRQVTVLQAAVAAGRNDLARARRILVQLGRAEPANLEAWYLLAQVAGGDARIESLALKHIAELHPYVKPSS